MWQMQEPKTTLLPKYTKWQSATSYTLLVQWFWAWVFGFWVMPLGSHPSFTTSKLLSKFLYFPNFTFLDCKIKVIYVKSGHTYFTRLWWLDKIMHIAIQAHMVNLKVRYFIALFFPLGMYYQSHILRERSQNTRIPLYISSRKIYFKMR